MTVWERIEFLVDEEPTILYQNWGPNLDGASLVTAVGRIDGRDVAIYGHDFTVRAGSMDATNGEKLARLLNSRASGAFLLWVSMTLRALHPRGRRWPRRLCRGVYRASENLRRCSQHYVHVRF